MSAPVWLLDFDGVINALSKRGDRNVWDTWSSDRIADPHGSDVMYPILWSPSVVEVISEAVDRGVNVVWLTTWREHTALLPDVVKGLPRGLPWWDEDTLKDAGGKLDPMRVLNQAWKAEVARGLLDPDVPVLWTDDNLDWILRAQDRSWFLRRPGGTSFIAPNANIGLSRRNVREIIEWIDENI